MELASQVGARGSTMGRLLIVLIYLLLFGGSAWGVFTYLSRHDVGSEATLTLGEPRLVRAAADAPEETKEPAKKASRRARPGTRRKSPRSPVKGKTGRTPATEPPSEEAPPQDDHGSHEGSGEPERAKAPSAPQPEPERKEPAKGGSNKEAAGRAAPAAGDRERYNAQSVRMVIKHYLPQLRVCYERASKQGGASRGVVEIQFTVSKTGQVSQAKVHRNTTGNTNLGKCIASVLKRWRFPRPAGGEMEFIYPFVFSAGG